jgi:hypothetical protein
MKSWSLLLLIATASVGCARGQITGTAKLTGLSDQTIVVTLSGPKSATVTTDAQGGYAFNGLGDGAYVVSAMAPSTLEGRVQATVQLSGTATAPDLVLSPVGVVTGRALLGGAERGNAGIIVYAGTSAAALTDDAGNYTLRGVPVGGQTISAAKAGYVTGSTPAVNVQYAQATSAPDLSIAAGATGSAAVSGVVVLVGRDDPKDTVVSLEGTSFTMTTDSSGVFSFAGVPTGAYPLSFSNGNYHETIPQVLVLPGGTGYISDSGNGGLYSIGTVSVPQATRIASGASDPLLSPDATRIIFTAIGSIQSVPLAGGATTTLSPTTPPSYYTMPKYQYLPNGNLVLLTADRVLKVVSPSGGSATPLGAGAGDFLVSPDGAWVVFWAGLYQNGWDDVGALTLVSTAGGTATVLAPGVLHEGVVFAPDSKGVFYPVRNPPGTSNMDLYYAKLATGVSTHVAGPNVNDFQIVPVPSAAPVAFLAEGTNIHPVDLATGALGAAIVTDRSNNCSSPPAYSGEAGKLAYFLDANVKVATLSGASPITAGNECGSTLGIAHDGSRVYYVAGSSAMRTVPAVAAAAVTTLSTGNLTGASAVAPPYIFSNDNKWVMWIESGGVLKTTAQTNPVGNVRTLATNVDYNTGGWSLIPPSAFSPDGLTLAVSTALVGNRATLSTVEISTGNLTKLADSVAINGYTRRDFGFSPDSTRVDFRVSNSSDQSTSVLTVAPAQGGTATPLLAGVEAVVWATSSVLVMQRSGAPRPMTFQDGLYTATVP